MIRCNVNWVGASLIQRWMISGSRKCRRWGMSTSFEKVKQWFGERKPGLSSETRGTTADSAGCEPRHVGRTSAPQKNEARVGAWHFCTIICPERRGTMFGLQLRCQTFEKVAVHVFFLLIWTRVIYSWVNWFGNCYLWSSYSYCDT